MMEKRVLNKLSHPNIVTMYGTFQDESSLYYHMEFLGGGELWGLTREKDEKSGLFSMVGVHWSLLPFYMAGTVTYLHLLMLYFCSFNAQTRVFSSSLSSFHSSFPLSISPSFS